MTTYYVAIRRFFTENYKVIDGSDNWRDLWHLANVCRDEYRCWHDVKLYVCDDNGIKIYENSFNPDTKVETYDATSVAQSIFFSKLESKE